MRLRMAALCGLIILTGALVGAARSAEKKKAGDGVFGLTKLLRIDLKLTDKEYERMQPPRAGGFGPPGGPGGPPRPAAKSPDKHRSQFGTEFTWVRGEAAVDGKTIKDVGLRYKGNYTYMASATKLKRSIKIDLNRHVKGQTFAGLKMLNLNNNVTDPSRAREALAYDFFRAVGVPAPRTAFAEVTLTVPGKYDKELLGLYTVVEQVDKTFLKAHFKDGKGLLLKPEGLQGGLAHLGDNWQAYEARYRPKGEPTDAQKKRLIAFTRLINGADDATFQKEIGTYLDVDAFLRFLAANALLANLDSFLGLGHNYYLYLRADTDRFVFIPWDLDLSLATWPAAGTPEQQVELSLMHPHSGQNKLIDRLLAMKEVKAKYRKVLEEMVKASFVKEKLLKDVDAVEKLVKEPIARETKAVAARREGGGGLGMFGGGTFGATMTPRRFYEKRAESVAAQLAGKSEGFVPRPFGMPGFGGPGGPGGTGGTGFGRPGGFPAPPRPGDVLSSGTQDALRLTAEQKKKLAELQKEVDAKLEKMLTDAQKAQLKRMREARPGFGPPGGFPGRP